MQITNNKWVVLCAMFCMYAVSNGVGIYALPLLLPQISQEFALATDLATKLPGLLFALTGIMAIPIGWMLDKFGARWLIYSGGVGLVITVALLPHINNYGHLILFYLFYAIFLSLSGIVSSVFLLNCWFEQDKGLAIGIFLAASSVGGVIFPQIVKTHIEAGWRIAAVWMAIFAAILTLLPLLLVREPAHSRLAVPSTSIAAARKADFHKAIRSPLLYLVIIVTSILWFCINGFIQNQGFYYKDLQISPRIGANIATTFSVCAILGKLLFGFLSDQFEKSNMMLVAILSLTLGCILLRLSTSNTAYLFPFAVVFGIGFSGAFTMIQLWVAQLFSGKAYGIILGIITMTDTFAGSYGIIHLGKMRFSHGSYVNSFDGMIALCVIAIVCAFLAKRLAKIQR